MAESSLRKLRRAAGYTNAKTFAEAVGIPGPTYVRYEQEADGPETSMPIKNAWLIADQLCTSIDALVGREQTTIEQIHGSAQAIYNALSPEGQQAAMSYLEFLAQKDEENQQQAQSREDFKYAMIERALEDEFTSTEAHDPFAYRTPQMRRTQFEAFLLEKAQSRIAANEEALQAQAQDAQELEGLQQAQFQHEGKVMTKLMEAYDERHPEATQADATEYAFIKLE